MFRTLTKLYPDPSCCLLPGSEQVKTNETQHRHVTFFPKWIINIYSNLQILCLQLVLYRLVHSVIYFIGTVLSVFLLYYYLYEKFIVALLACQFVCIEASR
ncbi:hypothetical protein GDO86_012881 [Hymenochirus boettgeri]|uniref:Uncharacterized protein n=1 Tax=Hymenochirus boettgeri TaxID=247094 RepID=A0A8T2IP47_9PIPI|nr:hypothetical protein GDO86_012881 [Hymenochirus boettgeri]